MGCQGIHKILHKFYHVWVFKMFLGFYVPIGTRSVAVCNNGRWLHLHSFNQPKLLIADEPTTALDVVLQQQILDLIRQLQQDFGFALLLITHDFALLLITHDFALLPALAHEVCVLHAGQIIDRGTPREILKNHQKSRRIHFYSIIQNLEVQSEWKTPPLKQGVVLKVLRLFLLRSFRVIS